MAGHGFVAGYGEVMQAMSLQALVNANRDPKKQRTPFAPPFPWDDVAGAAEQVTLEEREALRARLIANSAFAHD